MKRISTIFALLTALLSLNAPNLKAQSIESQSATTKATQTTATPSSATTTATQATTQSSSATTTQILTLEECREMALENNNRIASAESQSRASAYTVRSLKSNYYPNISANALYYWTDTDLKISTSEMPLSSELSLPPIGLGLDIANTFHADVMLTQPLYMGGKIRSSIFMAKTGEEIAALNEIKTRSEVIEECDKAYWDCVKAKLMHTLAETYKKTIEEVLRNVNNACEVGMASNNDLLKVNVKLNEAKLNILKSENAMRIAKMNLCQIVGLPLLSDIDMDDKIEGGDRVVAYRDFNIENRPEYRMLSEQIELYEKKIKFTRSDFLPSAAVMVGYGYTNSLKLKGENELGRAMFGSDKLINSGSFSALATLKIPVFHWGEGNNKVKAVREEQVMADLQRKELGEKMELEVQLAINGLNEALMEEQLTTSSLEQAEENRKVSANRYNAGMETLADLLEAHTMWCEAAIELINARISVKLAETAYLKALGEL